jgi:D-alanyl-D-alanine dipeptidase
MRRRLTMLIAAMLLAAPTARSHAAPLAEIHPAPSAAAIPPQPPAVMRGLIGEYGSADDLQLVFEADGELYLAQGGHPMRLQRLGQVDNWFYPGHLPRELRFERDRRGTASALWVNGERFARVDLGALAQEKVRASVRADPDALRRRALAATPPVEGPKRRADLVAVTGIDPTIRLDIRYATTDNFMGIRLYERADAFLQRPAAEALGRVSRALKPMGYGLMVHDAYRPWYVTWMFWEATPPESHQFVADPAAGSRHNRGAAVDLTLYELGTGRAVEMPGRYDELSHRSYPTYAGGTSRQRWLRDLLRREMEKQGFTVYPQEWWHFDHQGWRDWPIGNRTFDELERRKAPRGR